MRWVILRLFLFKAVGPGMEIHSKESHSHEHITSCLNEVFHEKSSLHLVVNNGLDIGSPLSTWLKAKESTLERYLPV